MTTPLGAVVGVATDGNDTLIGDDFIETFDAGRGDDVIDTAEFYGDGDFDTIVFRRGDGQDLVYSADSYSETVISLPDLNAADIRLLPSVFGHDTGPGDGEGWSTEDLVIEVIGTGDRLWLQNGANNVTQIEFADGSIFWDNDIRDNMADWPLAAQTGPGDDGYIDIPADATSFDLEPGNRSAYLEYGATFGTQTITLTGVELAELGLEFRGSHYVMTIAPRAPDGLDGAEIWLTDAEDIGLVEIILADSGIVVWGDALNALLNSQAEATAGDDYLEVSVPSDVGAVAGLQGDDVIYSNVPSVLLEYARGDGHDVVKVWNNGTADAQVALSGIDEADVTLVVQNDHLLMRIGETAPGANDGGTIRFVDAISGATGTGMILDQVTFDGGAVWTAEMIRTMLEPPALAATDGNDLVENPTPDATYQLGLGDDVVITSNRTDTYIYNTGDGHDVIAEDGSSDGDTMHLPDLMQADVRFVAEGQDLLVVIDANAARGIVAGSLRLVDALDDPQSYRNAMIERFVFADGELGVADVLGALVAGQATSGADSITASDLDDIIVGGAGDDTIAGEAGNDIYQWQHGDGNDVILDTSERSRDGARLQPAEIDQINRLDLIGVSEAQVRFEVTTEGLVIHISDSSDGAADGGRIVVAGMFTGQDGRFTAYNGAGVDAVKIGDEVLSAGTIMSRVLAAAATAGADYLTGTGYGEVLEGGAGDDLLEGGGGDDVYRWSRGDGNDHISDDVYNYRETDYLRLAGVDPASMTLKRGFETDLEIVIADSAPGAGDGARLTVAESLGAGYRGIEMIVFDDGTAWQRADFGDLIAAAQSATSGDDRLYGTGAPDTIEGLGGDDRLLGAGGADLYLYTRGDGADQIIDTIGAPDTIRIAGYAPGEVSFDRRGLTGPDLIIRLAGAGDEITVVNALANGVDALAEVVLSDDGTVYSIAAIKAGLVAAHTTDGDDIILGTDQGDDLSGGAGSDLISGGAGDDIYRFAAGDGDDRLTDTGRDAGDVLYLDGLNVGDLSYALRAGPLENDIALVFAGGRDRIILEDALEPGLSGDSNSGYQGVDRIVFDDGTEWDRAEMRIQALKFAQTAGSEYVWGFGGDDIFTGSAGNDTIIGDTGSDLYVMARGHGHDRIEETDTTRTDHVDIVSLSDFVSSEVVGQHGGNRGISFLRRAGLDPRNAGATAGQQRAGGDG